MKIIAVDPGAVASGVACIYSHTESWFADQYTDPLKAWEVIEDAMDDAHECVFLVEDFQTSAQLTREGRTTIGYVGFFELAARVYHSHHTILVKSPQHRLSGQREAAQLMGGTIEELKRDPSRKDAFSALSHCCVYRRTVR